MELITKKEFAKRLNCAPSYISKLLKQGIIREERDGRIDLVKAIKSLEGTRDPAREPFRKTHGKPRPKWVDGDEPPSAGSFYKARAIREAFNARIAQLDYEERTGKLVNADEIKRATFNKARVIRDSLLNIPDRIASILAAEKDAKKVHQLLLKEIKIVLEELAKSNGISG